MNEELTLLPCPACGHPVGIARTNGISAAFVICRHIGCALSGPIRKTDEAAVAAWNALPRAMTWTNEPPKVPGGVLVQKRRRQASDIVDHAASEVESRTRR